MSLELGVSLEHLEHQDHQDLEASLVYRVQVDQLALQDQGESKADRENPGLRVYQVFKELLDREVKEEIQDPLVQLGPQVQLGLGVKEGRGVNQVQLDQQDHQDRLGKEGLQGNLDPLDLQDNLDSLVQQDHRDHLDLVAKQAHLVHKDLEENQVLLDRMALLVIVESQDLLESEDHLEDQVLWDPQEQQVYVVTLALEGRLDREDSQDQGGRLDYKVNQDVMDLQDDQANQALGDQRAKSVKQDHKVQLVYPDRQDQV